MTRYTKRPSQSWPTLPNAWAWRIMILAWVLVTTAVYPYRGKVVVEDFTFEGEVIKREIRTGPEPGPDWRRKHFSYHTAIQVRRRGLDVQWATIGPTEQSQRAAANDAVYRKAADALLTLRIGDRAKLRCMTSNYNTNCRVVEVTDSRGETLVSYAPETVRQAVAREAEASQKGNFLPMLSSVVLLGVELLRTLVVFMMKKEHAG